MDKVKWCMNQKNGIKLVKPNENLCRSYMMKAKNALRSMNLNFKEDIDEWATSAAYYARYHMIYALLRKCGIKSEIHECTLEVAKFLFNEEITEDLLQEIS
ncbi:HEPN domain-containing protein, partial [bacterium]|nr:HEPN domain-containing protein [bacterium]